MLALECVLALRKQRTSEEHCPNLGLEVKTPIILPFLGRLSRAVVPRATVKLVDRLTDQIYVFFELSFSIATNAYMLMHFAHIFLKGQLFRHRV